MGDRAEANRADDLGVLAAFASSVETGHPYDIEHRLRRADGVYRWFQGRCLPLGDAEGRIIRWYSLLTDIEDRKRAEDALRATERDLRLTFDTIPGFVWTKTAAGEVELVNQQMLAYLGKTLEELKEWELFVHPDDRARVIAYWRSTIEAGQPYDAELRLRRADGVYRWFHGRGLPLRDTEGRVVRWYNLLTDIDERKKAEEKLRRSEWNLLEAQRLGHSGSWSPDISSGIVTSSPEMIRVFGAKPDEDYLNPDFWFNRIHPEDRKRVRELFERCVIQKIDYQADYRIVLPDGTIKYQHSIGYPILNEAGDIVEFVGTAIDSVHRSPAPKRIALGTDSYTAIHKALTERLAAFEAQRDLAFSADFP